MDLALATLKENNEMEEVNRNKILNNHRKNYDRVLQSIQNLINLYISPENTDRSMLTDEQYKTQKNALVQEKSAIDSEMKKVSRGVDEWLELTEKTFNFATYAKHWFDQGVYEQKTQILRALGQKIIFKDGKLDVSLQTPYLAIKEGLESEPIKTMMLEKDKVLEYAYKNGKNTARCDVFSVWSCLYQKVRTYFEESF